MGGTTQVGYIYGGLIANAPHVFGNPTGLSSASGEVFAVLITRVPEPTSIILALVVMCSLGAGRRRA
ncbi:PEP-CTERM sorting domain-containing protein [Adhaeretor mobilis]|uniref:PEP-CTERM sorting domain-containing protein n=1 Tax=Adhaeretor mobilis TaxID=1930276 RepID=UPI0036F484DA